MSQPTQYVKVFGTCVACDQESPIEELMLYNIAYPGNIITHLEGVSKDTPCPKCGQKKLRRFRLDPRIFKNDFVFGDT
jgi:hypothetical protein